MTHFYQHNTDRFEVVGGYLVRIVENADGRGYRHRCPREAFEAVAHAFDEAPQVGQNIETLVATLGLPHTQVNVALEFLKERGCVVLKHRRTYPAKPGVHLDAMIEYCALAEEPEPA